MDTLYSWSIKRAGAGMTITHSCGRIVNIQNVRPDAEGRVIAESLDRHYILATPAAL